MSHGHAGADIGKDGPAALEACAWFGHAAAATALLRAGADPNGREGRPLIFSANRGHVDIAQLLLVRGANASVANQRPLLEAVRRADVELVNLLLACGADPSDERAQKAASVNDQKHVLDILTAATNVLPHQVGSKPGQAAAGAVEDKQPNLFGWPENKTEGAVAGRAIENSKRKKELYPEPDSGRRSISSSGRK